MGSGRFLVLGATGGIGKALVRRLAEEGHRTFIAGRDGGILADLATETGSGWAAFDARRLDEVEAGVTAAVDSLGGLDGVAHCVGSLLLKPVLATSPEEFQDVLSTNLVSAFNIIRATVPILRREGGSVVLVSSAAARLGLANHEAIGAAKAGVEGLALAASASYAHAGLRFNVVAPGLVETPLTVRLTESESSRAASEAMHALGRLGTPDDVARSISWLLQQSWITGQVLGVDGGLSRVRPRR